VCCRCVEIHGRRDNATVNISPYKRQPEHAGPSLTQSINSWHHNYQLSLDVLQREIDNIQRELGTFTAPRKPQPTPGMRSRILSDIQDYSVEGSPPFWLGREEPSQLRPGLAGAVASTAEPRQRQVSIKPQSEHRRSCEVGGATAAAGASPTSSGVRSSSRTANASSYGAEPTVVIDSPGGVERECESSGAGSGEPNDKSSSRAKVAPTIKLSKFDSNQSSRNPGHGTSLFDARRYSSPF